MIFEYKSAIKFLLSAVLMVVFYLAWFIKPVSAATLYLDPESNQLNRNEVTIVAVNLDIRDEEGCINAIDAVIKYDSSLELIDVSTGNSLINLWVENPIIDHKNKLLSFAGGIPNGYCGQMTGVDNTTNSLLEMVFKIDDNYTLSNNIDGEMAQIYFSEETTLYLNDGLGTAIKPNLETLVLSLFDKMATVKNSWKEKISADNIPPAEFVVTLQQSDTAFGGKYYIIFNTTDKQTGIDHYEVMEEPLSQFKKFNWGRQDAPWVTARSPYVLKDQSLNSIIRVKAIDKAGNEYIANLIPNNNNPQWLKYVLLFGGILSMVFILFTAFTLLKKTKKNQSRHKFEINHERQLTDNKNTDEESDGR